MSPSSGATTPAEGLAVMSTELCATQVMAMMGSNFVVTGTLQAQQRTHIMLQRNRAGYPPSTRPPVESHTSSICCTACEQGIDGQPC